jgi:hypothetical protein
VSPAETRSLPVEVASQEEALSPGEVTLWYGCARPPRPTPWACLTGCVPPKPPSLWRLEGGPELGRVLAELDRLTELRRGQRLADEEVDRCAREWHEGLAQSGGRAASFNRCMFCGYVTKGMDMAALHRHLCLRHSPNCMYCDECSASFPRLSMHLGACHGSQGREMETAMRTGVHEWRKVERIVEGVESAGIQWRKLEYAGVTMEREDSEMEDWGPPRVPEEAVVTGASPTSMEGSLSTGEGAVSPHLVGTNARGLEEVAASMTAALEAGARVAEEVSSLRRRAKNLSRRRRFETRVVMICRDAIQKAEGMTGHTIDWAEMVESVMPEGQTLDSGTMAKARNWFYREPRGSNRGELEYLPQEVRQRAKTECERLGVTWAPAELE